MIPPSTQRIDLDALVKAANERFAELTPEQQREHREAQKKSWCIGELMLSHPELTRELAEALYEKVR